jgi:hypothetical protein
VQVVQQQDGVLGVDRRHLAQPPSSSPSPGDRRPRRRPE